jgi:hypothetical protein
VASMGLIIVELAVRRYALRRLLRQYSALLLRNPHVLHQVSREWLQRHTTAVVNAHMTARRLAAAAPPAAAQSG